MVTLQKFIVLLTRKEFMTDATNKTKTKKENKNTRKIDKGSDLYPGCCIFGSQTLVELHARSF